MPEINMILSSTWSHRTLIQILKSTMLCLVSPGNFLCALHSSSPRSKHPNKELWVSWFTNHNLFNNQCHWLHDLRHHSPKSCKGILYRAAFTILPVHEQILHCKTVSPLFGYSRTQGRKSLIIICFNWFISKDHDNKRGRKKHPVSFLKTSLFYVLDS